MGKFCSVLFCESIGTKSDGITYHRMPFNKPKMLAKWKMITLRGKTWNPAKNTFICSEHFDPTCFIEGASLRRLRENSIPTRIKLTMNFRKRQPLLYVYIEQQLLKQPGVTEVNFNEYVKCEFDKNTIKEFVQATKKITQKTDVLDETMDDTDTDKSSSEDETAESHMREEEVNIIWDKPIKEEVDPLDISEDIANNQNHEDQTISERIYINCAVTNIPEQSLDSNIFQAPDLEHSEEINNSINSVENNVNNTSSQSIDIVGNDVTQESILLEETNLTSAKSINVLEPNTSIPADPLDNQITTK